MSQKIEYVSPKQLRPDPNQPRTVKSKAFIKGLARNILQEGIGIINPIEADSSGMIVTGELRWLAAQEAGLDTVPVKRVEPATPEIRFFRQVSENVLQLSAGDESCTMSPMDVARALKRLLEMQQAGAFGKGRDLFPTVKQIGRGRPDKGISNLSDRIGKNASWISKHLALIEEIRLPREAADKVESGQLPYSTALEIIGIKDIRHRKAVARRVAKEAEKGAVHMRDIRAVRSAVEGKTLEEAKPIIELIQADKSPGQMEREIEQIAPTLPQAIEAVSKPTEALYKHAHAIQTILRDMPDIEAFSKIQRPTVVTTLQRLRGDIDEFLGSVDEKYLPLETETEN